MYLVPTLNIHWKKNSMKKGATFQEILNNLWTGLMANPRLFSWFHATLALILKVFLIYVFASLELNTIYLCERKVLGWFSCTWA